MTRRVRQGRRLLRMRDDLLERLSRIEQDRRRHGEALPAGFGEQAVACENDEVLDRLEQSTREELAQVTHAIDQFERGLLGTCERCGRPIDGVRLATIVQATRCVRCRNLQERVSRRHMALG